MCCALSSVLELEDNEAAVSICLLRFTSYPDEGLMLAVGTVQGLTFYPRQADGELSCTSIRASCTKNRPLGCLRLQHLPANRA